jgi:hypothetical protein
MKWWDDPSVKRLYAVGQAFTGKSADGAQEDGWMVEGLFETEPEAIANCTNDVYFVVPVPIGMMMGLEIPDGAFWPRLQTKEEGQKRIDEYRQQKRGQVQ